MSVPSYNIVDFDVNFDPVHGGSIFWPENTLMYRGYDTSYAAVSSRPTHFGPRHVAVSYVRDARHAVGAFVCSRPLRLLDLRYVCVFLKHAFSERPNNDFQTVDPIVRISVGYGLCSFEDQIKYARSMFPGSAGVTAMEKFLTEHIRTAQNPLKMPLSVHPITPEGVRIAETMNDAYICEFLKSTFGDKFDGFIAPRLRSVYHIEKNGYMTGEIVVFNPARCGVKEVPIDSQGKSVSLESVLNLNTARCTVSFQGTTVAVRKPTRGGAASKLVVRDPNEFNDMLQRKDPNAINLQKQAIAAAKVWKKHIKVIDHCAPHPNTPVSSWLGR